jgi:transcriptional regulator with XRE-family HTH domain
MSETIGARIQAARERKVYGRSELARAAGLSAVALYRIETGQRHPRHATIRKIAAALGIDPLELVDGTASTPTVGPPAPAG